MGMSEHIISKEDSKAQTQKVDTMLFTLPKEEAESFATRTPMCNESRSQGKKSDREISIWLNRHDSHYAGEAGDWLKQDKTRKNTLGYRMVGYAPVIVQIAQRHLLGGIVTGYTHV